MNQPRCETANRPDDQSHMADAALADYLRRVEAGEPVNRDEFLKRYPDAAESLRAYFEGADLVEGMAARQAPAAKSLHSAETIAPQSAGNSSLAAGPFPTLPTQFGRFRVDKMLGRGAMGAVYLAWDTQLERPVALKVPKLANLDEEIVSRLLREARAAAILSHPHICRVYDVGTQDDLPFIAMEYIEGRPLSEFIDPANLLDERRCVGVVRKLALALAEAHAKGIIHRDLKPANILINHRGEPILTDFGLARLSQSSDGRATQSGTLIGSPAYMSPEQANADAARVGPRSDIYGLGVLLFELLTSELPFQGSVLTILSQIATKEPPAPSSLRPGLDVRLDAICLKMMAKNPDDRFPSMKAVELELGNWLKSEPIVLPPKKEAAATPPNVPANDIVQQERRARKLLEEHDYEPAIPILTKLAALKEPQHATVAAWAKKELPAVKQKHEQLQARAANACEKARALLKRYEYAAAVQELELIPKAARSPQLRQLLSEATDLYDDLLHLQEEIKEAVTRKKLDGVLPLVRRFLKLKPDHPKMLRLARDLERNRAERAVANYRGTRRYIDVAGRLIEPKEIALGVLAIVGLFFAVTIGLRGYLEDNESGSGTPPMGQSNGPSDGSRQNSSAVSSKSPLEPTLSGDVYLDDLNEESFEVGWGTLGKHGNTGWPGVGKGHFQRATHDHALSVHPESQTGSIVRYRIGGRFQRFVATVGLWDAGGESDKQSATPLTFKVVGDGKLLWQSQPMQMRGQGAACDVAIDGIQELRLLVDCSGSKLFAAAVWINPVVTTRARSERTPNTGDNTDATKSIPEIANSFFPLVPGSEYTYESWGGDELKGEGKAVVEKEPTLVANQMCRVLSWSENGQELKKQYFYVDSEAGIAQLTQQTVNGIQSPPLPLYPLDDRKRNWDWTGRVRGTLSKAAFTLDGPKSVTVPMGTFDGYVMRMEYKDVAETFSHSQEDTLVAGIGLVRTRVWNSGVLAGDYRLKSVTGLPTVTAKAASPRPQSSGSGSAKGPPPLDAATLRESIRFAKPVTAVGFNKEGTLAVAASFDEAKFWVPEIDRVLGQRSSLQYCSALHVSGDISNAKITSIGQFVAGKKSVKMFIHIWNSRTNKVEPNPAADIKDNINLMSGAISPDGKTILFFSNSGTPHVIRASSGTDTGTLPIEGARTGTFSFDSKTAILLIAGNDKLQLFDVNSKTLSGTMPVKHQGANMIAISSDGKTLLTAGEDKTARLWDAVTGEPLGKPMEHPDKITAVAFRPFASGVLTGCADGAARYWDVSPILAK